MDYRELREVMKFLHCKGLLAKDIYADMLDTLGDSAPSFAMVKKWVTEFRKGRVSTEDLVRSGRPRDVSTYENVDYIRNLIKDDERVTVQDIAKCVGISFGSVHAILSKLLEMVKVSGRWVPRRVPNDRRMARLEFCKEILAWCRVNQSRLVQQTVVDDAWIYHFERTEICSNPGRDGHNESGDEMNGILSKALAGEPLKQPESVMFTVECQKGEDGKTASDVLERANGSESSSGAAKLVNGNVSNILAILGQRPVNGDQASGGATSNEPTSTTTNISEANNAEALSVNADSPSAQLFSIKRQNLVQDEPPKKKQRSERPSSDTSCVFWDSEGVILVETLEPGQKLTGELYCRMLEQLKEAMDSRRPGALEQGVLLIEDQAPAGAKPPAGLQLLPIPPNSPDLSPSDFHIFPKVKEHLRYRENSGLMSAIKSFLKAQEEAYYKIGLTEMEKRCTLCIDLNGDYVEK